VNDQPVGEKAAAQADVCDLILRVERGSRSDAERLFADVHKRHKSKSCPLFTGQKLHRFEGDGFASVVTSVFSGRRDLIDRLMQRHSRLDVSAILNVEDESLFRLARYEDGNRTRDWVAGILEDVDVITIASGDPAAIAAFAVATSFPESHLTNPIFIEMRSSETGRDVRVDSVRLQHIVTVIQAVHEMSWVVAGAFPELRFEFFAIPASETIRAAQAVFAGGRVVEPWRNAETRGEIAENATRCWSESVGLAAGHLSRGRGR
jgi:hypothetical protein